MVICGRNNSLFIKYNYVLECSIIMKLIYENGRFFKKKNKKLIEVNKYGVPIVRTDAQLKITKRMKTQDVINKKMGISKGYVETPKLKPNFTGEVKSETSLVEGVVDVATTKEGMATIGGATAGGWFGSSVGLAGFWGGIAGTFPIAIVGGVIGYLAVKAFSDKDKKKK